MDLWVFGILLFVLQGVYWFVGKRSAKGIKGEDEYFLAGRGVKFFPLMMTFLATQVGGGIILGSAEEAYRYGWPVLLFPMGTVFGLIALGLGIGKRLASFPVTTVSQILEVVYGSSLLKRISSVLSMVSLYMILVGMIIASSKFFASVGLTNPWLFALFWASVILYTAQGGLKSVISTDMIQAGVFCVILLGCFGLAVWDVPPLKSEGAFGAVSSKLCGWLFMPFLFMMIEQDMGQRCFAGSSPKVVSRAAFWAGIVTLAIAVVPVYFGIVAQQIGLVVPAGTSVLMAVVLATTNPWVTALVGCAVLAAIVSTATSLINAISSNLSSDFSLFQRRENLQMAKGLTALISVSAILFGFYFDNVVDMLVQSYELSVSCLFVPIFVALFKRKGHFISAALSIALGTFAFFLFRIIPLPFPREIASVLFSCMGYACGEMVIRLQARRV